MKELQELRNEVLSLRNMGELTKQTESILLHKLNALQEAINYTRCCKSDSELLVCDVDYLSNFTKGVEYLCKPDGLKHFEVEDDFGGLYKLHRKLFKKTEQQTNCLQLKSV